MPRNDVVLLDSVIDKYGTRLGGDQESSELFELFCFDTILKNYELSHEELEYGHVDGGDDGGIDGLYVFLDGNPLTQDTELGHVRRNPEIEVIIITAKHGRGFKQIPINNLISSLTELLDMQKTHDDILYPFAAPIPSIREAFRSAYIELAEKNPFLRIKVIYASRGETATINPNVACRARELELTITSLFSNIEVNVDFLGASELLQLARKQRAYALRLRFIENTISRAGTNYVVLTSLSDYYDFVSDEDGQLRRYLFESNVRDFLGSQSSVVRDISQTLNSEQSKEYADFWWFSNGVTLLASNAFIVGKELCLENPQIVNGMQTTNAIYDHFVQNPHRDDRALLVKTVVTDDEEIRDRIIKATNYQNAVSAASLRATDRIQRDIEQLLETSGWYYDRRKNYYKNQGKPVDRIISPVYLGNIIRALVLKSPDDAVQGRTGWMGKDNEYSRVFNPEWDPRVFVTCVEVSKTIDLLLRQSPGVTKQTRRSNKGWKHIIAAVFIAKSLGNIAFSAEQLAVLEARPTTEDLDAILFHLRVCQQKLRKNGDLGLPWYTKLKALMEFALAELKNNGYVYHSEEQLTEVSKDEIKLADHLRSASECEKERDFEGALLHLEATLEQQIPRRQRAIVHAHIARVLAKAGKSKLAVSHYEDALSFGLETSQTYSGYARSLYKTKAESGEIGTYFVKAIELDNTNAYAHSWYATFLKSTGNLEEAEQQQRYACSLRPNNAEFLNNLALLLMQKGDYDSLVEAKELLERAVPLSPEGFRYPEENLDNVLTMLDEQG